MRAFFLIILIVASLLGAGSAFGATGSPDHRPAEVLRTAENLLDGRAAVAAGSSPEPQRLTLVLRELDRVYSRLGAAGKRRARAILARPDRKRGGKGSLAVEADPSPVCDQSFCVHWSKSEPSAPVEIDLDADSIPDFVEEVQGAAARSFAVENGALGWRAARSDGEQGARGGRGAEGQVDIYLVDLGRSLFGYADADRGGPRRRSAYLVLDNDYRGFTGSPLELMQATVAHEYNHVLQFGYDASADDWLFESTATWIEDQVYPEIDDYLNFVPEFAKRTTTPMAEVNGRQRKIYGSAMWNHWLSARFGPAVVRETWEASAAVRPRHLATAAYDRAIGARDGSFSERFVDFAAATAEWNSDDSFPDAGAYPDVRRRLRVRADRGSGRVRGRLDHTGYALIDVDPGRADRIRLKAKINNGVRGGIALVGRMGPNYGGEVERVISYLPEGGRATVTVDDVGRFRRLTAVVVNADGRAGRRGYRADRAVVKAKVKPLR